MWTLNTIVFSLTIILFLGIKSTNATVPCTSCPGTININIESDADLNTEECTLLDAQLCTLGLRIDYTNSNDSYAFINSAGQATLVLTNGEPEVSERTSIWFNELRV